MKVYIHENTDDTTLLLSNEGRVLGVYSDIDDARIDYVEHSTADENIFDEYDELDPLDFDDAA